MSIVAPERDETLGYLLIQPHRVAKPTGGVVGRRQRLDELGLPGRHRKSQLPVECEGALRALHPFGSPGVLGDFGAVL